MARSGFQLWPIMVMMAIIENMISPDYVLCYIPRVLEVFHKEFWKIGKLRVMISKVAVKL